jgi:CheY-like chemotaxis protein
MAYIMPKILIADDSRFQVQLLASYLGKGFEVTSASDALQAWMAALRSKPDVILLDINMPGGTGLEVLKRLRMSTKTQHIPVIVVSGNESEETEKAVRDLGAADFLHKPVEKNQLCDTVNRALGVLDHQANRS